MSTALEPANTSAMGRGSAAIGFVRERWGAMPAAQRRLLLWCAGALLALSALSAWWGARTDWRTLFSGMEGRDAAQMQQQLSSAGIAYQTTPDGATLQVPAEELDKARVAISAGGLPQSGRMGFELFDKPSWVGSEFDEKVNYRRALEGELEHTIGSLEAVRSARVHIVLPKQGAFASEDQPAKASAVLKLRHANLPREQSDAIRNLVAGSVEGLKAESVTLVDADGRIDLSPGSRSGQDRENELALQNKLIQVLEPLAGSGNVHATVSVSYVDASEDRTDEVYDPQSAMPAGTLRDEQASQRSLEASSGHAVSRHITHREEQPGRVRRLTAAVVVNDRALQQADGTVVHTVWEHRSADEIKRLQQLAQAAVGFDEARGDQVVLENVAFSGNSDPGAVGGVTHLTESAQDLFRTQPALPRMLATVAGLLLLGLLVLRPLTRQAVQLMKPPPLLTAGPSMVTPVSAADPSAGLPDPPPAVGGASFSTQEVFDRVSQQIKAEPRSSTRLVSSWIGTHAEEEV